MSSGSRGSRHWVPVERRTPVDASIVAKRVPSFPIVSRVDVSEVENRRQSLKSKGLRVGWNAVLVQAYSKVSQDIPELREVYVARPVAYVYRHPEPVASLTIHRRDANGQDRLIWARISSPHALSLIELQSKIDRFTTAPIHEVYRDGLRLERRGALLRRFNWHLLMRWCGRKRAKHLGTFSISSLGHLDALNLYHPLVTATSLAMGPISQDGHCDLALICDHRVLDGVLAARSLQLLTDTIRKASFHD